ncbi:MAG: Gfo/Idh/MocA family oxidoreductase [Candidatus Latescibacteria bacterium]|nr:Gfo/Idh/MocA family oxidoreductase [Candidatus Latescibacterota bacterium]
MKVRTAVFGAGLMGREHLRALAQVEAAEVVAVFDPAEGAAAKAAAELGVPEAYTDLDELMKAEEPEYVVVASPPLFHAQQSIAAFEAGAHVLCEKPLCMDRAEADAIVAAAKKAGRLFTMGFQIRQSRVDRALKQFIAEGGLGQVYHTRVWGGHIMNYPWGRFHHRREFSFGGVMAATIVHILDAALWVLGCPEPVTVSASCFRRLDKMPDPPINFVGGVEEVTVEDFSHAHVRFADGSSMSIDGNWLMHPTSRGMGFEVLGVLGVAKEGSAIVELERKSEIVPHELAADPDPQDRTVAEHAEFVAAIRGQGEAQVRFAEALAVQRILVGIYESAAQGREVRV